MYEQIIHCFATLKSTFKSVTSALILFVLRLLNKEIYSNQNCIACVLFAARMFEIEIDPHV